MGYSFFRCRACAHVFVWPLPSNVGAIYSEDYFTGAKAGFGFTNYDVDKLPMIPAFQQYLVRIERVLGGPGSILDVGAATGFFLNLARARHWTVRGVDASSYAAEAARSKGIDVQVGFLEACAFPGQAFDAISLWDVIEHMTDPCATMRQAAGLLRAGGVLAINTPDSGSLLAKIAGLHWHLALPPEHLNLFSRASLRVLLEKHGLEILEVGTIGKVFTLQYIFQTLGRFLGAANHVAHWLRGRPAGAWSVPINLHDNVFLLARKR